MRSPEAGYTVLCCHAGMHQQKSDHEARFTPSTCPPWETAWKRFCYHKNDNPSGVASTSSVQRFRATHRATHRHAFHTLCASSEEQTRVRCAAATVGQSSLASWNALAPTYAATTTRQAPAVERFPLGEPCISYGRNF
jgi:hypothetical protein